jgi:hypothetical protein
MDKGTNRPRNVPGRETADKLRDAIFLRAESMRANRVPSPGFSTNKSAPGPKLCFTRHRRNIFCNLL